MDFWSDTVAVVVTVVSEKLQCCSSGSRKSMSDSRLHSGDCSRNSVVSADGDEGWLHMMAGLKHRIASHFGCICVKVEAESFHRRELVCAMRTLETHRDLRVQSQKWLIRVLQS